MCYFYKNIFLIKINNFLSIIIIIAVRKYASVILRSLSIKRTVSIVWAAGSCIGGGISRIVGVTRRIIRKRINVGIWHLIRVNNYFFINKSKNKNENKNCHNALSICFPIKQCLTYSDHNKISDHSRKKCSNKNFQYFLRNI